MGPTKSMINLENKYLKNIYTKDIKKSFLIRLYITLR
jgi:hypothetical protein